MESCHFSVVSFKNKVVYQYLPIRYIWEHWTVKSQTANNSIRIFQKQPIAIRKAKIERIACSAIDNHYCTEYRLVFTAITGATPAPLVIASTSLRGNRTCTSRDMHVGDHVAGNAGVTGVVDCHAPSHQLLRKSFRSRPSVPSG